MFYDIIKLLLRSFIKIYNRISVYSSFEFPKEGSYIVVANHSSYLDPIFVGVALPRKVRFMAKKESFKGLLGKIITSLGAFPVNRDKADIKAIKTALRILKDGEILAMFPEGGRRTEDDLSEIKQGAAFFAVKTGCPIIPIYIKGADKIMPKGSFMIKPKKVEIYIGQPINILETDGDGNNIYEIYSDRIKEELNRLKKVNL